MYRRLEKLSARSCTILRNHIKIFFGDHPPPHFHAVYGEYNASIGIESLEIIEGDLPNRAEKMVIEWATLYQKELLDMWNSQEFSKLPPLK